MAKNYKLSDLTQKGVIYKREIKPDGYGGFDETYTKSVSIWVNLSAIVAEQYTPYSPASGVEVTSATYKIVTNSAKIIKSGDILKINSKYFKVFKSYMLNPPFTMYISEEVDYGEL